MLRLALSAALISLLAACDAEQDRAPFAESRTPPGLAGRFFPPEGWAWGYVQVGGGPAQRYGVAAPRGRVPRANVLVIIGAGESAEAWFETVADLNARGAVVWVLERAGQAGSGRYADPREMIHAPSFDADVAAVRAMVKLVVRPAPTTPLVMLAHADGTVVALRAVESGLSPDHLILSTPRLSPPQAENPLDAMKRRFGRGATQASGWASWSREAPDAFAREFTHDRWRGGVQHAWQLANPDLRMSGESIAWRQGLREAAALARRDSRAVRVPTLMILGAAPATGPRSLCELIADCTVEVIDGAGPAPHLESDRYRRAWLEAIGRFSGLQDPLR